MKFAGIDYHKRYSVVCIVDEAGRELALEQIEHSFPSGFERLLSAHTPCAVAFEATMNWSWLHELIEPIAGVEKIVMANPLHVRLIAAAQVKTDKIDARKLAQLLRAGLLPSSHIPDRATRLRKEVLRQRTFWVRERTKLRSRIHRLLGRQHDLQLPQVSDLFGRKGRSALGQLHLGEPDDLLLRQQLTLHDALQAQIAELEKRIAGMGGEDRALKRLVSVPGIGLVLGNVLATEIDGIGRFGDADHLCSYAGLVPDTSSSGGKTYHGRLVAACNKWLRWALVEAAWVAVGCSPYFGAFYRHQRARGKKANTAILIVARRMCQIIYRLLKEDRDYQPRSYHDDLPGRSHSRVTQQAA